MCNLILKLSNENKSYGKISEILRKTPATVKIILKNDSLHGNVLNKTRCGRSRKLTVRDERIIMKKVKKKIR